MTNSSFVSIFPDFLSSTSYLFAIQFSGSPKFQKSRLLLPIQEVGIGSTADALGSCSDANGFSICSRPANSSCSPPKMWSLSRTYDGCSECCKQANRNPWDSQGSLAPYLQYLGHPPYEVKMDSCTVGFVAVSKCPFS